MKAATISRDEAKKMSMDSDNIEQAAKDGKISRRTLLRSTANLTAGVVAVGTMSFAEAETTAAVTAPLEAPTAPDHDPATGEIFDRDRHHHWDTV